MCRLEVATLWGFIRLARSHPFEHRLCRSQGGPGGYVKRLAIVSQRPSSIAHQHKPMQTATADQFRIWARTLLAEVISMRLVFGGRSTGMAYHPSKYRPKTRGYMRLSEQQWNALPAVIPFQAPVAVELAERHARDATGTPSLLSLPANTKLSWQHEMRWHWSEASLFRRNSLRECRHLERACLGAQMVTICDASEVLQKAQALEDWADCRERAVAKLEPKVLHLLKQNRTEEAARLRYAARYLHEAALRDRAQAAALRASAHQRGATIRFG